MHPGHKYILIPQINIDFKVLFILKLSNFSRKIIKHLATSWNQSASLFHTSFR